jgi:hypothetical protein
LTRQPHPLFAADRLGAIENILDLPVDFIPP